MSNCSKKFHRFNQAVFKSNLIVCLQKNEDKLKRINFSRALSKIFYVPF